MLEWTKDLPSLVLWILKIFQSAPFREKKDDPDLIGEGPYSSVILPYSAFEFFPDPLECYER